MYAQGRMAINESSPASSSDCDIWMDDEPAADETEERGISRVGQWIEIQVGAREFY